MRKMAKKKGMGEMQKITKYRIMYIYLSIFQKKNSLMKQKTLSELKILF